MSYEINEIIIIWFLVHHFETVVAITILDSFYEEY